MCQGFKVILLTNDNFAKQRVIGLSMACYFYAPTIFLFNVNIYLLYSLLSITFFLSLVLYLSLNSLTLSLKCDVKLII